MLGEQRHFSAVSLIRNIDALWDSSATWTLFAANSMMGGLPFLSRNNDLGTTAFCPRDALPQRSQNFQRSDARKRFHFFFTGVAGRFLLGSGTAVDCRVHRSPAPEGWRLLCKSGTDSRRALTSLLTGCVIFFLEHILSFLAHW